jgi:hypothetical protein
LSIAAIQSSVVASSTSTPMLFMTRGTVSRSSVSTEIWPLYFGSKRSSIEVMSGARSVLTISPVMPLCHGAE